jgi:chemotaxis protein methyltransferase CheR
MTAVEPALPLDFDWQKVRLTTSDFKRIRELIETQVGIQTPPSKRVMVETRLRRRVRALGMTSFSDYVNRIFGPEADQEEIVHLIDAVTTNKTDFFREPSHFDYLVREALPTLLGERDSSALLTLWSAASSTGEEPYTLAMVLDGFAENRPLNWRIVASDVSTEVLARAQRAIYPESLAEPIPTALRYKYLLRSRDRERGLVRIVPRLRQKVNFLRVNLLSSRYDIPKPVDVIFCRNVFIYFNRETQGQILGRFCDYLRPGGYVFLGHSETVNGISVSLVQVAPTIYRKL